MMSASQVIRKNIWLKLFSLGLAVLIWFTINLAIKNQLPAAGPMPLSSSDRRVLPNLPVLVMSSADNVHDVRVSPKEVEVTVQGESRTLKNLKPQDIRVVVDLSVIQAAHDLRTRIAVWTPPGVTEVRVDPEEVQVIYPSSDN